MKNQSRILKFFKSKEDILFPVLDVALNGLNYFFHIFVSWYISPQSYGILNSLLSISAILFVFGISMQTYTAKITASQKKQDGCIYCVLSDSAVMAAAVGSVYFIMLPMLLRITRSSLFSLATLFLIFAVNAALSIFRGYFQGSTRFFLLNKSFYVEVFVKIVFLTSFMGFFPDLNTALISILIGMTASLLHAYLNLKRIDGFEFKKLQFSKNSLKNTYSSASKIFASNFFLYYFTSIDMITVNYLLPQHSGPYAVMLRYSQITHFIIFSVITVFIPYLSQASSDMDFFKAKVKRHLFFISAIAVFMLLNYTFTFPYTVAAVFGQDYLMASSMLPLGGAAYSLLAFSFYLVNVFIVLERKNHVSILFASSISITLLYALMHKNIYQILRVSILTYSGMLILLSINLSKELNTSEPKD
ncbi:Membrane protein involved in the export of O-antigen and teichoic acid [Peptoclostridium litorale DSM 5388]|uniref:Polysaccharide biosynthesis protein n=1 Tax=Peptoclostridium litorale DSM 5388 TaxID=1121324 RepID=A0A069RFR9_PEPLI|nr:oligosaccharide flippase family protein [Peptoclostridium litorale]KDR95603.1 polysaccharide biosynthesis protein [Peptoclostridium litorale DSM 5388]SIN99212.1 Membrane protein involved in the export of O-antigen and teichoic acid [Peptoclostridium litorale DSM 5388]